MAMARGSLDMLAPDWQAQVQLVDTEAIERGVQALRSTLAGHGDVVRLENIEQLGLDARSREGPLDVEGVGREAGEKRSEFHGPSGEEAPARRNKHRRSEKVRDESDGRDLRASDLQRGLKKLQRQNDGFLDILIEAKYP
jgi:hypothetical protein